MIFFRLVLGVVISYLLGCFPAAYVVAKFLCGKDIRKYGSGNVGATNAMRMLGKLPGVLVLIVDVLKGVVAASIVASIFTAGLNVPVEIFKAVFGFSVVCGHIFNIFLKFKGGKGVATSAGVFLTIAPLAVLFSGVVFLVVVIVSRYVSLGSIISSIFVPFFLVFTKAHYSYSILGAGLCVIIVIKHKENIKSLLTGRERKVFEKK